MNKLLKQLIVSSADPNKLGMTVKGALVAPAALVGLVLKAAGHGVDNNALQDFVEILGNVTVAFATFVSSLMIVIGAGRKLYNEIFK